MSHLSVYKVQIGNLTTTLVKQALTFLASQIGATVTLDTTVRGSSVLVRLKVPCQNRYASGEIGFNVNKDGTLTMISDNYNWRNEWDTVKAQAENMIKAYKTAEQARNQNIVPAKTNIQMKVVNKNVIMIANW